jgi:hypothetical protein
MTIGGGYICIYKWEWVRPPAVDPTRIRSRSDGYDVGCTVRDCWLGKGKGKEGGGMMGPKGR